MSQKTVIIWDSCGEDDIKFFVLEGDLRALNNIYANLEYGEGSDRAKAQEALNVLLETQLTTDKALREFPTTAVLEGAFVIACGFFP